MKKVVAHGTFDIIHFGHINYLENAKKNGNMLLVLVTSDKQAKLHNKYPYFNERIRKRMIACLKIVDEVIIRDQSITCEFLQKLGCDVFVTTDKKLASIIKKDIKTVVLPRTPGISTTKIKNLLKKEEN